MKIEEELMQPRYKVIADWPEMRYRFKGNPIIVLDAEDKDGPFTTNGYYQESFFIMYPHLFRKLAWWEERKPEDMPEYVKYAENGRVAKVTKWDLETTSSWFMFLDNEVHPYCPGGSALLNTHWLPATEQQYKDYLATINI